MCVFCVFFFSLKQAAHLIVIENCILKHSVARGQVYVLQATTGL